MNVRLTLLCTISVILVCVASTQAQTACSQGTPYKGCDACGNEENLVKTRSVKAQNENVLKNRDSAPTNPKTLKLSDLRDHDKNNSFYPDMGVEVSGFVARVVPGGIRETCNCKRDDLRDIVIDLVASPDEANTLTKHVILEISPRWQPKLALNDANYLSMFNAFRSAVVGKWVTFRGWLFYDSAHVDGSESTNPKNYGNWRATPWEIHPVTYYKVLTRRPADLD